MEFNIKRLCEYGINVSVVLSGSAPAPGLAVVPNALTGLNTRTYRRMRDSRGVAPAKAA